MECSNCKSSISKSDKFCEQCGGKVQGKRKVLWISAIVSVVLLSSGIAFAANMLNKEVPNQGLPRQEVESEPREKKIELPEEPIELPEEFKNNKMNKIEEQWIYYSLGEDNGSIYKFNANEENHIAVFESTVPLKEWHVVGEKIVYTTAINWDELGEYYNFATNQYEFPNNNFVNAIYSSNIDGTDQLPIVEGDIYNMHNPNEPNMIYDYELLLTHDDWIYFQIHFAQMESGGWIWGSNLSKIRADGTGLTKLSDEGVSGQFSGMRNGKAYFDSSSYGEEYDNIVSIDLETGRWESVVDGGYIVGIQGDTMYYHVPDYFQSHGEVRSLNLESGEEGVHGFADDRDYKGGYYLEGNTICYDDYEGEKLIALTLDFTAKQIMDISYSNYYGINKDGYRYYTGSTDTSSELYKKNLITGKTIQLLASPHEISIKFK